MDTNRSNLVVLGVSLLAGVLIGFAASSLAYRYQWLRPPEEGIVRRMDRLLKLTPGQHEQVEETMLNTRDKVTQLRGDFRRQRAQLIREARQQIRASLTPEQQTLFDRYFARSEDRRQAAEHHP